MSIFRRSRTNNSVVNRKSGRKSNSFKHLCMSSLHVPTKMKKIQSKMKALEWPQHISQCKYVRIFPHAQGQLTQQSAKFDLCRYFMVVLVTCKNKKYPIKNEGATVATRLHVDFFRRSRADNFVVNGGIWQKFKLIQAFMHVLTTCKNEEESIKNEGAREATTYLPL